MENETVEQKQGTDIVPRVLNRAGLPVEAEADEAATDIVDLEVEGPDYDFIKMAQAGNKIGFQLGSDEQGIYEEIRGHILNIEKPYLMNFQQLDEDGRPQQRPYVPGEPYEDGWDIRVDLLIRCQLGDVVFSVPAWSVKKRLKRTLRRLKNAGIHWSTVPYSITCSVIKNPSNGQKWLGANFMALPSDGPPINSNFSRDDRDEDHDSDDDIPF
jgi:hypothetical protein